MNKYEKALDDLITVDTSYVVLKELVERATPKNVIDSGNKQMKSTVYDCPNCGRNLGTYLNHRKDNNCNGCGQTLDW